MITVKLVGILGIRIDKQHLDSTHIFGRTRHMGVAIKRFLSHRRELEKYSKLSNAA